MKKRHRSHPKQRRPRKSAGAPANTTAKSPWTSKTTAPALPTSTKTPSQPYVTNKPKGTGLGLAIVKKIVHEHDGTISAGHSRDLGGAKITITLPITASQTP